MTRWFRAALGLEDESFSRIAGFFGLYLLLFGLLTLADGLSTALFVKRVGAASLPLAYAVVAVANLVAIGFYVRLAERMGRIALLVGILLATSVGFVGLWVLVKGQPAAIWYGAVFGLREVAYTLVLMHFGTVVQEYFTREHLVRAMPLIYAGGRVGGLLGGATLSFTARAMPLGDLLLVCAGVGMAGVLASLVLGKAMAPVFSAADDEADAGLAGRNAQALDQQARGSLGDFLRFVWASPLMRWQTITSLVYVGCRFVLNFQHNTYFETHFESEADFAAFMGTYTVAALSLSLFLQVAVVGRMVAAIGLKGGILGYGALLGGVMTLNAFGMDMTRAVLSRLAEVELRFGWRNPLNQLVINKFSKALRVRVRAWSMGLLIPGATVATSALLGVVAATPVALGASSVALGLGYLGSNIAMTRTWREPKPWLLRRLLG